MTDMSETTAAGVEVLNSFNATMTPEDEELLLQQRILQSKALDDRRSRQRAEEELKFARHKLSERDRKLVETRATLNAQSSQIGSLQKQLANRESENATLKGQVHDLAGQLRSASRDLEQMKELRALSTSNTSRTDSAVTFLPYESTMDTPQLTRKNSISHLSGLIAEKAKNIGLKRKFRLLKEFHEQTSRSMECSLMEEADLHSALTERCLARGVAPINDLLKLEWDLENGVPMPEPEGGARSQKLCGLVSYDGMKRYGRGNNNVLNFNEPLNCKMPEDVFIDAKVQASSYSEQYSEFRSSIHGFAKAFKKDTDNALNGLWFIFTEKDKGPRGCVLANPKEDFQKELRTALAKTKTHMLDLIRSFNSNVKTILGSERKVKQAWLQEQRPVAHMEVQCDIPPPEDPRIAELQEEVKFLKSRQAQIYSEHGKAASDLEMQREKAEVNMQFLQQKVFALHSAVHTALHSVYKHRFHWGPRCPNHFSPLNQGKAASKKRQLEVGYNVLLGQAIDLEIKSLGKFADYFVSDQLFGVDLAAAFNIEGGEGENLVMRKKEAVPMKAKVDQARKLSTQLDTMLKEEKAIESKSATSSPALVALELGDEKRSVTHSDTFSSAVRRTNEKENAFTYSSSAPLPEHQVQRYVKSRTPPPMKKTTLSPFASSAAACGDRVSQQVNGTCNSARRNSTTVIPSVATKTTASSVASSKRPPLSASPPNTHMDAASTAACLARPTSKHTTPKDSPVQMSLAPSTITLELGIDIGAAPPKAPPVARFQNNRRTTGSFVAFSQQ